MLKIVQRRVAFTCADRKSWNFPRQKNYILLIIQSTGETDIWLGTRSNLSANVPVEISKLYSTTKMISAFALPSEKTMKIKSLCLLLKLDLKL